jgi:hypothetical protein
VIARSPSRERFIVVTLFCSVLLLGAAALVTAGVSDQRTTAFSVDVPPSTPVALVGPRQTVCQTPLLVASPTAGLTVWAAGPVPRATGFLVTVHNAETGAVLARTELTAVSAPLLSPVALRGRLTHPLARSTRVTVCLSSVSSGVVNLLGSTSGPVSGALTLNGKRSNLALAMIFSAPRSQSLIALLPTVFARAALFHPRWIGAWTFWALLVGLVISAALVLRSILVAQDMDDQAITRRHCSVSRPGGLERVSSQADDREEE